MKKDYTQYMKIESARFIKSALINDTLFEDGIPQVAFIGRSNVGKSSVINSLVGQRNLAKTSSFPGRTQMINIFLINKSLYFIDLPGYGYAKISQTQRSELREMIRWYFFVLQSSQKKVVLIIDGSIGPTKDDMEMLHSLEEYRKNIVVVANKIDRVKQSVYKKHLDLISNEIGTHIVIPYSAKDKIGINELLKEVL